MKAQEQTKLIKAYSYIRFSSKIQERGDSIRRQTSLSKEYAKKHNLFIDETLNMQDLGISAFRGSNKSKGALGEFLRLVDAGKVEKGSYLLVEAFDRISREETVTALTQFLSIIAAGVRVVTLQDGILYDSESISKNGGMQLQYSIMQMALANSESEKKSIRLQGAWKAKRAAITTDNKRITRRVPYWITVHESGKFLLNPDVCHAIELIFRKKLAGVGSEKIALELNQMSDIWHPEKGNRNTGGWRKSYINKLLKSRTLIGEFQPHTLADGKREPIGETLPDYYPKAIDTDLFNAVQNAIATNKAKNGNGGGKTGKAKNLFAHVARCGICGSALHFIDKGEKWQYLHCTASRMKSPETPCKANTVNYHEVVKVFFNDFEELNISEFLPNHDETQAEINHLHLKSESLQFEISDTDRRIKKAVDIALNETEDEALQTIYQDKVKELTASKKALQEELTALQRRLYELDYINNSYTNNIQEVREVFKQMEVEQDEEKAIYIRKRLNAQLRKICSSIKIYPSTPEQEIKDLPDDMIFWKDSEKIQKIVIKFAGVKKFRILQLQGISELVN